MSERERLLGEMAEAIQAVFNGPVVPAYKEIAEASLRVLEAPRGRNVDYSRICTCGQNGYTPGSINSNHDHYLGCPQYDKFGKIERACEHGVPFDQECEEGC